MDFTTKAIKDLDLKENVKFGNYFIKKSQKKGLRM